MQQVVVSNVARSRKVSWFALTLTDALDQQAQQLVKHADKHVKVMRKEINEIPKGLDHGR